MPVALPDITVVVVATVAHRLTQMALADTLEQITPAEVIVWTDAIEPWTIGPIRHRYIKPFPSIEDWYRCVWYDVPIDVRTSHFLIIQWDGWVLDGKRWTNEFLEYDYIGAVWPWHDDCRVGNGGFRLTSTRIARFLAIQRTEFPLRWPDDELICRIYRGALEHTHGFRWAPEHLARQFSIEHGDIPPGGTFGFHDCRNWPRVMPRAQFRDRLDAVDDYTRSKMEFKQLVSALAGGGYYARDPIKGTQNAEDATR